MPHAPAPLAELHLHLEGSVDLATMQELAPGVPPEQIRAQYQFTDFGGFLQSFKWVVEQLRRPEDYGLITHRLLERLAAQDIRQAEITLSAGVVLWKRQEFAPVWDALRAACAGSPVKVGWILDAVRHFGPEHVLAVARLAAERAGDGAVAFSIGGDEARGPAEWFTAAYQLARDAGLHLLAHAGETTGPESVWGALHLGAERIGHGIRAIDDPALVRHLRERDVPLEICITSNLRTGAVASLEAHPVRRLFDAGVPITLNTDDPALFDCTLAGEYELAARAFGFSDAELRRIADNAFRYAF